jgi:F420-dependent oxidoreductase-like protein
VELAVFIEGQAGLNWPRWQRIAQAVEELGYAGLYRSDHFTPPQPPDIDALELWISLAWLASHTRRIEFGPLVSPISFRHPNILARQASAVDDLSGGRLTLGIGAGWQEREHYTNGFELLDRPRRFDRFEEGLAVVTRLLRSDTPSSFDGSFFQLRDAILLPRPQRPAGPSILVGGNGLKRTLPLAARYADEWNAHNIAAGAFVTLNARLDELLREQGRLPGAVCRSLMTSIVLGRDDADVARRVADTGRTKAELIERGFLVGTATEIVERLGQLGEQGVQRVMWQRFDLDDLDTIELMARAVLPKLGV